VGWFLEGVDSLEGNPRQGKDAPVPDRSGGGPVRIADTVAEIKDVRSPVFTSKFCHFLLPQVFPVVGNRAMGNRAMGNRFPTYQSYFECAQAEWLSTPEPTQTRLSTALDGLIGAERISRYPTTSKIAELCLIGRRQS
jgi:hypothetical protein